MGGHITHGFSLAFLVAFLAIELPPCAPCKPLPRQVDIRSTVEATSRRRHADELWRPLNQSSITPYREGRTLGCR